MFPVYRSCPLGIYHVCKSSSGCLPNGAGRGLGLETTQMLAFRRDNIGAADARPPVLALEFRMIRALLHGKRGRHLGVWRSVDPLYIWTAAVGLVVALLLIAVAQVMQSGRLH